MPRFGDHEPAVRVLDVAEEVLAAAGVVEADDRRADQPGAAEREEVVGRVVEQHGDVPRPLTRQPFVEELREPARLREVLAVRPRAIAELDRERVAELVALRRSSAAAFGATSGAWPGAGIERERKPDIGVSLRAAGSQPPEHRDGRDLLVGEVGPVERGHLVPGPSRRAQHPRRRRDQIDVQVVRDHRDRSLRLHLHVVHRRHDDRALVDEAGRGRERELEITEPAALAEPRRRPHPRRRTR